MTPDLPPVAAVGGRLATGLLDVTSDLTALDGDGFWAVLLPYDGEPVCARFANVRPSYGRPARTWHGPRPDQWTTSLDQPDFENGVRAIRDAIADGDVYQVNLTRRLTAPAPIDADVLALGAVLAGGNPAPYAGVLRLPAHGVHVASASPERFLRRIGREVETQPIKGTAATTDAFLAKDRAENVMIVDLMRNDLGRVCEWGSINVPALCAVEEHPGLVHLVSTVRGTLRDGVGWAELIDATFPPGSVTGAPKVQAMKVIGELEATRREAYTGAIGYASPIAGLELSVTIRTFELAAGRIWLGVGGGIGADSDPQQELDEALLKARPIAAAIGTRVCTESGAPAPTRRRRAALAGHR